MTLKALLCKALRLPSGALHSEEQKQQTTERKPKKLFGRFAQLFRTKHVACSSSDCGSAPTVQTPLEASPTVAVTLATTSIGSSSCVDFTMVMTSIPPKTFGRSSQTSSDADTTSDGGSGQEATASSCSTGLCHAEDLGCSSRTVSAETKREQQLDRILSSAAKIPQPDDEKMNQSLGRLWHAAYGTPCMSLKNEEWKKMGWQGTDPTTDFRGCGQVGLDCLLYMAEHHGALFQRLLHKEDEKHSGESYGYPFATAGINVAYMLLELLGAVGQGNTQRSERPGAGRGILQLMEVDKHAFEELFVAAFECLDQEWERQGASYMLFGQVVKAVKSRVESCLVGKPAKGLGRLHGCWRGAAPRLESVAELKLQLLRGAA